MKSTDIKDYALTSVILAKEFAMQLDDIGIVPTENTFQKWLNFKNMERYAADARRQIEDELIAELGIAETDEGSRTVKADGYKVKVTCRMNRTIDADTLQQIAAENNLTSHLGDLFRWKPEINTKAWKDADESITAPLLGAITTKPGRPSFSIELNDKQ